MSFDLKEKRYTILKMSEEIIEWSDIANYENYQVSNNGQVKNVKSGKILKLERGTSKAGYFQVGLCNQGQRKRFHIQRLVAESFLENPDGKLNVEHIDENVSKNNVSNLRWV